MSWLASLARKGRSIMERASLGASSSMFGLAAHGLVQEEPKFGVRYINLLVVKQRMKAVKNIQKITKAMKMVAASKLRGAQVRVTKSRGLWQPFARLLGDNPNVSGEKLTMVPVTSDRGLCGGINSTVAKFVRVIDKVATADNASMSLVISGEKGKANLSRTMAEKISKTIADTQKVAITFPLASMLAEDIMRTEYDSCKLLYNHFNSVLSSSPTLATVQSPAAMERALAAGEANMAIESYEIEGPDRGELLLALTEFQLAAVVYNGLLENACSEMGARMNAMENSTNNASDMLGRLTLTYNRGRQAKITTELIEIISGASALEG